MKDRYLLWAILAVTLFTLGSLLSLNDGKVTQDEIAAVGAFLAGAGLMFALLRGGKK